MVKDVLSRNQWLKDGGVRLIEQGSFTNRINARGDSDIDLRVHHPGIRVDFESGAGPARQDLCRRQL